MGKEGDAFVLWAIGAAILGLAFYFLNWLPITLLCFIGAGMLYFAAQQSYAREKEESQSNHFSAEQKKP